MKMFLNRSFARRVGRGLSQAQRKLLDYNLTNYLFSKERLIASVMYKAAILEIGFGMGEHLIYQAKNNIDKLYIGAEVYMNGVANVLKLMHDYNISNVLIWPDDIDLILKEIPNQCLSGVYILFPDPWPKRKQIKRRVLNTIRLDILCSKLKQGSFFIFASDINEYFAYSKDLLNNSMKFELFNDDFLTPPMNYIATKYHKKACNAGRSVRFLQTTYIG